MKKSFWILIFAVILILISLHIFEAKVNLAGTCYYSYCVDRCVHPNDIMTFIECPMPVAHPDFFGYCVQINQTCLSLPKL